MGTRSLTRFIEPYTEKNIVTMYRQFDGYPNGHGLELAHFLKDFDIVNGLSRNETKSTANGMGCLSAQVIAHFKTEPGGIYLYGADASNVGEEYVYEIRLTPEGNIMILMMDVYEKVAKAFSPNEFISEYDDRTYSISVDDIDAIRETNVRKIVDSYDKEEK